MKNICIVTWYKSSNYGTCLQAIALNKVLKDMGFEPYMLEYGRYYTYKDLGRVIRKVKKRVLASRVQQTNSEKNNNIQRCINDNLKFVSVKTKKLQSETFSLIDCFLVGSDQVWNPDHFDEVYLLDFVPSSIRKGAYATSIGVIDIPKNLKNKYIRLWKRFDFISVREEAASKIISNNLLQPIPVVLDPTLLLSGSLWEAFASNAVFSSAIPEEYILAYFVGNNNYYWDGVREISLSLNLPVIIVPLENTDCNYDFIKCDYAGPYEFVSLISNARFICTDSFHACAFSINLNKDFVAFRRFNINDKKSQNGRLDELFQWTGLENRYYDSQKIDKLISAIDYSSVNKCLEEKRNSCKHFLYSSI